jgi:hypothetical protein
MDNDNLPGLSPLWLISLATLFGILLPIMVPVIFGNDIRAADWIGFSGSVLTAGVASAAVYYAWRGIKRQLRADFLSREEDRIERELPGLFDAEVFGTLLYNHLAEDLDRSDFLNCILVGLEKNGFGISVSESSVISRLPNTDLKTRYEYRNVVLLILLRCQMGQRLERTNDFDATVVRDGLSVAIERLNALNKRVIERRLLLTGRLPNIRRDIEAHLF